MNRFKIILAVATIITPAGVASCLFDDNSISRSKAVSQQLIQMGEAESVSTVSQDSAAPPEMNPDNPQYLLKTRGFPNEVPLSQAVEEFNRRAERNLIGKTQPPLTADEIVASIRDWDLNQEPIDPKRYAEFQTIAKTGVIPKGSYFFFNTGTVSHNGYDIDAWHIYLRVGLDKYPDDIVGVPSYSRLIRTKYISSRPTRLP